MKKVFLRLSLALLAVVLIGGGAAAYWLLSGQDRGMSADGRMVPPASARNAGEAPHFDASKTPAPAPVEQAPACQLPTDFKLPTNLDISTPAVPEGISQPASAPKT